MTERASPLLPDTLESSLQKSTWKQEPARTWDLSERHLHLPTLHPHLPQPRPAASTKNATAPSQQIPSPFPYSAISDVVKTPS